MDLLHGFTFPELAAVGAGFALWVRSVRGRCRECDQRTTGLPEFAWRGPRCRTCRLPLRTRALVARSKAYRRTARGRARA